MTNGLSISEAILLNPPLLIGEGLTDPMALWFNRGMGSEMGFAQLLALKVLSSTTLEF